MTDYRTLDDVTLEHFAEHLDEIDAYLSEAFADFGQNGASAALLSNLRAIAASTAFPT